MKIWPQGGCERKNLAETCTQKKYSSAGLGEQGERKAPEGAPKADVALSGREQGGRRRRRLCTVLESNPKNQENHGEKRTWSNSGEKWPGEAHKQQQLATQYYLRARSLRGVYEWQLRGILLLLFSFRSVGLRGRIPTDLRG